MIQLAQMEQIQLELIQNPLVSLLHGEIPYRDEKTATDDDQYRLSNAGRLLFEALWYQMLQDNNTSGIGLYLAPVENMKLESLSEAPSAMDIVKQGYSDTMSQAGMGAIIPLGDDTRAATAQISLQIESKFMECIYRDYERMMNAILKSLNLKYDFRSGNNTVPVQQSPEVPVHRLHPLSEVPLHESALLYPFFSYSCFYTVQNLFLCI